NFPSINNSSDDIKIVNSLGIELDKISYNMAWYHDASKQDGGWSIERINPDAPCNDLSNWKASVDASGGTPAQINSVYNTTPDTIAPSIQSVQVISNQQIRVFLTELSDSLSIQTANFTISNNLTIDSIRVIGQRATYFDCYFS